MLENIEVLYHSSIRIDKEKIISVESSLNLKLVTRINHNDDTIININGNLIGGNEKVIIAGPCAIENEEKFKVI